MTDRTVAPRASRLRCTLVAAAFTALTPLLGGCVSAVDESSAFGFASGGVPAPGGVAASGAPSDVEGAIAAAENEASATETASDASEAPDGDTEVAAPASAAEPISPRTLETVAAASRKPAAEAATQGSIGTSGLVRPASAPAVAAFASPAAGRQADRSLYASLYNESRARTPLKNAEAGKSRRVVVLQPENEARSGDNDLPGVDPKSLFEIGQRASVDSELMDDIGGEYQLASLTGIARLAPSGLLVQREDIVTSCFDRDLMGLISQIETRFRQKVVITSGMRTPSHNRRVNGAKASLHMACKAADLHVPGVNGQEVARFVRALPTRGGVGTYCHTAAIHIDTGAKRDWNWPCRTRRAG